MFFEMIRISVLSQQEKKKSAALENTFPKRRMDENCLPLFLNINAQNTGFMLQFYFQNLFRRIFFYKGSIV